MCIKKLRVKESLPINENNKIYIYHKDKIHTQNKSFKISIIDVKDKQKHKNLDLEIKKIIDELSKIINLKFQLIDILNDFSADIRISCNENNFSWSPIGTDIYLNEYKDKPNMNLKELDDIKHEFGHMLGLDHEHQKLGLNIEWDQIKIVDLIMKNYNINEITEASTIYKTNFDEINNNLNIDQSIDFDADSVMCYFFFKRIL